MCAYAIKSDGTVYTGHEVIRAMFNAVSSVPNVKFKKRLLSSTVANTPDGSRKVHEIYEVGANMDNEPYLRVHVGKDLDAKEIGTQDKYSHIGLEYVNGRATVDVLDKLLKNLSEELKLIEGEKYAMEDTTLPNYS